MSDRPTARTVGDLIDEMAARIPDREAVVLGARRLTYRQLGRAADTLARALLALGFGKGDHIAILMGNRPDWLVTWFAANKIGAVAVGVSTWSTARELAYVLRHSDAKAFVMASAFLKRDFCATLNEVCPELGAAEPGRLRSAAAPFLRLVVLVDGSAPGMYTIEEFQGMAEQCPPAILAAAQAEVRPEDVALICYTSGSTGTPKGVELLHGTMIHHAFNIGEAEEFAPGDRFWLVLPLFWSAGNANTSMVVMTHGGTVVLQEGFDAADALELFEKERCTHYFAFPNMTAQLYNHPSRRGRAFDSLRVAVSTGNPEGIRMLRELGFKKFCHPYGTTEDYGFATINSLDDPIEVVYHTQGRPLPNIDLRIVDPATNTPLGANQAGEVCMKGNVTIGYYKDAERTRQAFDAEGYYHTGDLGFIDQDGRLHFQGRLRELIRTGGINVAPAEVEEVLLSHPLVVEAHVVGIPDDLQGEIVAAFVKIKAGACTTDELHAFCRERLSSYKMPRLIRFRSAFPLTDTGKVSKRQLVEEERHTAKVET